MFHKILQVTIASALIISFGVLLAQLTNPFTETIGEVIGYWLNYINYLDALIPVDTIFTCIILLFNIEFVLGTYVIGRMLIKTFSKE